MNSKTNWNKKENGSTGKTLTFSKQIILFSVVVALVLVGCIGPWSIRSRLWPAAGMGEFCTGEEPFTTAFKAMRTAVKIQREVGTKHAVKERQEMDDLRDKAQCIFSAHAERGDPNGMYYFALTILGHNTNGIFSRFRQPPNGEQVALSNLKKAALKGHGKAFIKSLEVPSQRRKGYNAWIKEAAAAGNHEAQYELGIAHLDTRTHPGIPRDAKAAEKWLTLSTQQGNVFATTTLARLYTSGAPGVKEDYFKAIQLLEPLLDKPKTRRGSSVIYPPFLSLAHLYCGISEKEKALKMFKRDGNIGDAEAKETMAIRCSNPGWWLQAKRKGK